MANETFWTSLINSTRRNSRAFNQWNSMWTIVSVLWAGFHASVLADEVVLVSCDSSVCEWSTSVLFAVKEPSWQVFRTTSLLNGLITWVDLWKISFEWYLKQSWRNTSLWTAQSGQCARSYVTVTVLWTTVDSLTPGTQDALASGVNQRVSISARVHLFASLTARLFGQEVIRVSFHSLVNKWTTHLNSSVKEPTLEFLNSLSNLQWKIAWTASWKPRELDYLQSMTHFRGSSWWFLELLRRDNSIRSDKCLLRRKWLVLSAD